MDHTRCALIESKTAATFGAWIRQDVLHLRAYFAKWDYQTQGCFSFQVQSDAGTLVGSIANAINDAGNNYGLSGNVISAGVWAHVVWRYYGAGAANADRLKLYVNNVEKALTFTGTIPATLTAATATVKTGVFGGTITRYFNGRIAEVVMYDHALSVGEIAALYGGYVKRSGLVLYAPLWGVVSPEPDLSGNLYNGTVSGAVLADHAPVGRYVPYRFRALPTTVGVEYINVTDSGVGTDTIVGISEWLTITDTGLGTESVYLLGEVLIDGLRLDHALRIRVSEPTTISSKPIPDELPSRTYLGKQGRGLEISGWVSTIAELNTLSALADGTVHYIQLPTGTRVPVHIVQVQPTRPIEPNEYPYVISAVEVAE